MNWEKIKAAVDFILGGNGERVDGQGFKAYLVGDIVRVDIETTKT
jgi:hypothetical protein